MILTIILKILYKNELLRKSYDGAYYCDPDILFISRICFSYMPITGKRTDDIKKYVGDWHRITLYKWQIEYLTYKRKRKERILFP